MKRCVLKQNHVSVHFNSDQIHPPETKYILEVYIIYIVIFFFFFFADYNEAVTMCNGKPLNPRCVCAYDMYILKVHDLCKFASGSNGSLNHVPSKFLLELQFVKVYRILLNMLLYITIYHDLINILYIQCVFYSKKIIIKMCPSW